MMAPLLEVRGLALDIPTPGGLLHPVRGVDFSVAAGETLAIVGESGCGKSLTALAVMGLQPHAARLRAQAVTLGGQSLLGLSERGWRKVRGERIAMIFQDPMTALDPCYRIGDQMLEVLRAHRALPAGVARRRALALLERVGISSPEARFAQFPQQLSGGLRQRVMIAMALLCEPQLILADEPTTALDVTIQAQILHLLAGIQRDTGIGLVLISHDLGVVAGIAHRVAVMYGGEIVESGDRDAILAAPRHPYTEGLLRSVPIPGETTRGAPLGFIPGQVPRQTGTLSRCGFADRCPYAHARCVAAPIPLIPSPDGRQVRCVLPVDHARDPEAWTRLTDAA
jgi:peptide/nickel transport system ATP-binding protein